MPPWRKRNDGGSAYKHSKPLAKSSLQIQTATEAYLTYFSCSENLQLCAAPLPITTYSLPCRNGVSQRRRFLPNLFPLWAGPLRGSRDIYQGCLSPSRSPIHHHANRETLSKCAQSEKLLIHLSRRRHILSHRRGSSTSRLKTKDAFNGRRSA